MIRKQANTDPLRSARIRNDSQEGKKLIRYDQQAKLQCKQQWQKGTQGALQFPAGRPVGQILKWDTTAGQLPRV